MPVEITGGVYNDANGAPLGCILNLRDISERKRLHRQIRQTQRLESLGRLAGGIAHNFNNLLMGIQGSVDLIRTDGDLAAQSDSHLQDITQCIKSGAEMTRQLLGMARGGKYTTQPIDINENIRNGLEEFSRRTPHILINWNLEKSVWEIEADRSQICLVITSLFDNARQAMSKGGCLFVTSENITLQEETTHNNLKPGRFVKISISDSGCALDSDAQEHIFDPFFYSKAGRDGTAVGLSVTYALVQEIGGTISVQSQLGKGTTFKIDIPLVMPKGSS